jgi:hypothetical protein
MGVVYIVIRSKPNVCRHKMPPPSRVGKSQRSEYNTHAVRHFVHVDLRFRYPSAHDDSCCRAMLGMRSSKQQLPSGWSSDRNHLITPPAAHETPCLAGTDCKFEWGGGNAPPIFALKCCWCIDALLALYFSYVLFLLKKILLK